MDLELDFAARTLNGRKLPARIWPEFVGMLAEQQQINSITLSGNKITYQYQRVAFKEILDVLLKENGLQQLTKFESSYYFADLVQLLSECPKLSTLRLQFGVRLSAKNDANGCFDLGTIINDKPITELELRLYETTVEELLEMFQRLKPNSLRKLKLAYVDWSSMDLPALVHKVANNSWAALEEIQITDGDNGQFDVFNAAVIELRSLQKCHVSVSLNEIDQLFSGVLSVLNSSPRPNKLELEYEFRSNHNQSRTAFTGCQIVKVIQQLHTEHPTLAFDFDKHFLKLRFSLGNVFLRLPIASFSDLCELCRSFYPIVIDHVMSQAHRRDNAHMGGLVLDRCRIERVVADLNKRNSAFFDWNALSADEIEDMDEVTITFERGDLSQFYISVRTGHCFNNNPCVKCVVVD